MREYKTSTWSPKVSRRLGYAHIQAILATLVVTSLSLIIGQNIGHRSPSGLTDNMIAFQLYDGAEIRYVPLMWILFGVALVFVALLLLALQAGRPDAMLLSTLLILFLTPEYVLSTYLLSIPVGTAYVTDALWWCWLILAVLYAVKGREGWRSLVNLPFVLVMLFLGYSGVALIYALMVFGFGPSGFSKILLFVIPFVVAVLLLRSQRDVRWFERALFIVAFYPMATELLALAAGAQRIDWVKLNSDSQHMLAMVMPLLVTNALHRQAPRGRWFVFAGTILPFLFGVQQTFLIVCSLSLLLLLFLLDSNRRRTLLKWSAVLLVVAMLVVIAIESAVPGKIGFWERFQTSWRAEELLSLNLDSSRGSWRAQEMVVLRQALERNPIFGDGLGSAHQVYFTPELWQGRSGTMVKSYFHWAIFWIPVNLGLPGTFIFLAIFGVTAGQGYRALRAAGDDDTRRLLTGALSMLLNILLLTCFAGIIPHPRYTPMFGLMLGYTVATVRLFGPKAT